MPASSVKFITEEWSKKLMASIEKDFIKNVIDPTNGLTVHPDTFNDPKVP